MAGQGKTTRQYAKSLKEEGWEIVYTCIPNTVHLGVIPIQTIDGASKQRYPDIVAYRENSLLLVEVEISINLNVYEDIKLRFKEMTETLSHEDKFLEWREKIQEVHGIHIQSDSEILRRLVLLKSPNKINSKHIDKLENLNINVFVNDIV